MGNQSNVFGRAHEYICIETLNAEINRFRESKIEQNSTYELAKKCWDIVDGETKDIFSKSALSAVYSIFDLEPMITEKGKDCLILKMQSDREGEKGDVRDIIIIRNAEKWQIGLSIKHNNFAVKHNRLGPKLDFGKKWYDIKCSNQYWEEITPIFEYINLQREKGLKWSELEDKKDTVYIPILKAFVNEIKRSYAKHPELPKKLVEYLLGEFDFYKIISIDNEKITQIQTYNIRGTLNKDSKDEKPKIVIPIVKLPKRIIDINLKPHSNNTVELYMDEGWQFSFRIHNASTYVENSLKFDI